MKSKPARVSRAGEVTWQVMVEAALEGWRGYEQESGKADGHSVHIHTFSKCSLSSYSVPGIGLGNRDGKGTTGKQASP